MLRVDDGNEQVKLESNSLRCPIGEDSDGDYLWDYVEVKLTL